MNHRGMIPITKNVVVLRADSSPFSMTYPKRARHLVKKGRARWKDANTIELTCPSPSSDMGDELNMDNDLKQKALEFVMASDIDPIVKNDQIIRLVKDDDNSVELLNRLIEELRNLIPAMNTDIPIFISAISDLDSADSDEQLEALRELANRAMDTKNDVLLRLENIVRCIVEAKSN